MGLIRRSFSLLDKETFTKLHSSIVRPHANTIWSPHFRKHIRMIENVQIHATKYVDVMKGLSYDERLKSHNFTI